MTYCFAARLSCTCSLCFTNKIQNTHEVKENAFELDKTGQNVRIFEEVLFFRATYNRKTAKHTISLLSLCQFDAGMLAEGVCFYVVRSLEREDFLENSHVLSCIVQSKSVLFNLLCVWGSFFSQNDGSQLCFIFFTKKNETVNDSEYSVKYERMVGISCLRSPLDFKIVKNSYCPTAT